MLPNNIGHVMTFTLPIQCVERFTIYGTLFFCKQTRIDLTHQLFKGNNISGISKRVRRVLIKLITGTGSSCSSFTQEGHMPQIVLYGSVYFTSLALVMNKNLNLSFVFLVVVVSLLFGWINWSFCIWEKLCNRYYKNPNQNSF